MRIAYKSTVSSELFSRQWNSMDIAEYIVISIKDS